MVVYNVLTRLFKNRFQKKNIDANVANLENVEDDVENIKDDIIQSDASEKCQECGQEINYFFKYCKPCNSAHFRNNFSHWTSGDSNIDELTQILNLMQLIKAN